MSRTYREREIINIKIRSIGLFHILHLLVETVKVSWLFVEHRGRLCTPSAWCLGRPPFSRTHTAESDHSSLHWFVRPETAALSWRAWTRGDHWVRCPGQTADGSARCSVSYTAQAVSAGRRLGLQNYDIRREHVRALSPDGCTKDSEGSRVTLCQVTACFSWLSASCTWNAGILQCGTVPGWCNMPILLHTAHGRLLMSRDHLRPAVLGSGIAANGFHLNNPDWSGSFFRLCLLSSPHVCVYLYGH
jgi:hypothetical protein